MGRTSRGHALDDVALDDVALDDVAWGLTSGALDARRWVVASRLRDGCAPRGSIDGRRIKFETRASIENAQRPTPIDGVRELCFANHRCRSTSIDGIGRSIEADAGHATAVVDCVAPHVAARAVGRHRARDVRGRCATFRACALARPAPGARAHGRFRPEIVGRRATASRDPAPPSRLVRMRRRARRRTRSWSTSGDPPLPGRRTAFATARRNAREMRDAVDFGTRITRRRAPKTAPGRALARERPMCVFCTP